MFKKFMKQFWKQLFIDNSDIFKFKDPWNCVWKKLITNMYDISKFHQKFQPATFVAFFDSPCVYKYNMCVRPKTIKIVWVATARFND